MEHGYIYIRNHPSYDLHNACKLGKTINIPDRDTQYSTGEIIRGKFTHVFQVKLSQLNLIDCLLKNKFKDYNVKYTGGTEFYSTNIINLIEPYFTNMNINFKKLTDEQIDNLTRTQRVKKIFKKINTKLLIDMLKNTDNNWSIREYQNNIINYSKNRLLEENKIYIELPTGGGKSFIVYNLLNFLQSNLIIIVSPRKIINSQNISDKYLQILTKKYLIHNLSENDSLDDFLNLNDNKIIICCTQSLNKIYNSILLYNLKNIAVWFDEAHWGVEDWTNNLTCEANKFWLQNNCNINYRIFTSASPNKLLVLNNENIFGKLYSPITVQELINLKWLAPITTCMYSENKANVENINYVLNTFTEKNRKYGFSFHNTQDSAFNLFYKHYTEYINEKTIIKPFLLIEKTYKANRIINLDYNYKNIKTYEESISSMGYVVAKYSMGYDFSNLDFLYLSDPKLSVQDIKQCIGRGIRSDQLGINGSNKEKKLIISIPIYLDVKDNLEQNYIKYSKIIEVLKYFLHNQEIIELETNLEEIKLLKNTNLKSNIIFKCDTCNKIFKSKQNLNYHLENSVCTKEKIFKCEKCNKIFADKRNLQYHQTNSVCEKK